jgi:hypothetical protein
VSLSREALIARWATASHQPTRLLEARAALATPQPSLRGLAARELATPGRYHLTTQPAPPPQNSIWMRLWTWLSDRWMDLWRATFGRAHLEHGTAVVIGDALIVVVALVILFVAVRLFATVVLERRARGAGAQALDSAGDAAATYAAACESARRGDYARASRLLFAATIAALSMRGVVREDRSATVGEIRRGLSGDDAALVAPFDAVASAFVTSAYAERPVDGLQWERAQAAYLTLTAQARA